MNSFKAYIYKEWIEATRTYRLTALGCTIIAFAFLNPILLKMLPVILKSQSPGVDFSAIIEMSQREALRSYLDSLYEIGSFVVVLSLMGSIPNEFNNGTLVIPFTSGAKIRNVYLSKLLINGTALLAFSLAGTSIAYAYSSILFGTDLTSFAPALKAGLLYGLYFIFATSLTLLAGSFFRKPSVTAVFTLLVLYVAPPVAGLFDLAVWFPFEMLDGANDLTPFFSKSSCRSILHTIAWLSTFSYVTVWKLEHMEKVR
ncbi:MAG TPA: hypothetical protein VJ990_03350 [Clostridia bacterium]|nr:hypothetical protein [Clostridia bacterium]